MINRYWSLVNFTKRIIEKYIEINKMEVYVVICINTFSLRNEEIPMNVKIKKLDMKYKIIKKIFLIFTYLIFVSKWGNTIAIINNIGMISQTAMKRNKSKIKFFEFGSVGYRQ